MVVAMAEHLCVANTTAFHYNLNSSPTCVALHVNEMDEKIQE